jgi:hypothetical protein
MPPRPIEAAPHGVIDARRATRARSGGACPRSSPALRLTRGSVRGRPAREPVTKPSSARSTAARRSFPTTRPYARRHSDVSEISHLITAQGNVPRVDAHDSYVEVARGWNRHATWDPASSVRPYFNRRTSSRLSDMQQVELSGARRGWLQPPGYSVFLIPKTRLGPRD